MMMKIALAQYQVEWLQPERNWEAAEYWIAKCADSDLVVLPEMFTMGFCMTPEESAQSADEVAERLVLLSHRYGVAIGGSVAVEEGGAYYNRFYFVKPSGEYAKYDKRHLFSYAGENLHYTAGDERVVVELCGVRFLLLVCYDIRFPVWSRNREDYDAVLCVANWPKSRRKVWDLLLRARAVENVCYVCGVNIVDQQSYGGGTAAIDFRGDVVASVEDGESGVARVDIDLDELSRFRDKFPALRDADEFEIKK